MQASWLAESEQSTLAGCVLLSARDENALASHARGVARPYRPVRHSSTPRPLLMPDHNQQCASNEVRSTLSTFGKGDPMMNLNTATCAIGLSSVRTGVETPNSVPRQNLL